MKRLSIAIFVIIFGLGLCRAAFAVARFCALTGNLVNLYGSAAKNARVYFSYSGEQNAGGSIVLGQNVSVLTDSNGNLPTSGGCLPSPGTQFCPPQGAYFYVQVGTGKAIKVQAPLMFTADLGTLILANTDPTSIVTNIASGNSGCSVVNPSTGAAGTATITCAQTNIANYLGPVGITGNQTNGSDHITGVCVNGVCPVEAFGAKGDGVTADDTAIAAAIAAVPAGGTVLFQAGHRYKLANNTLSFTAVQPGFQISGAGYGLYNSHSVTTRAALVFTGTPTACTYESGGFILPITNSALTISNLTFEVDTVSSAPTACVINWSNNSYGRISNNFFTSASGQDEKMDAIFLSHVSRTEIDHNIVDAGVWIHEIYGPADSTGFTTALNVHDNTFNSQSVPDAYVPMTDIEYCSQCQFDNNTYELGPNGAKFNTNGASAALEFHSNWMGDDRSTSTWVATTAYNTTVGGKNCVTPVTFSSNPYVFCTNANCGSGNSEPSWNATPGSITPDTVGGGTCQWYNEGAGIGLEAAANGTISGNILALGGPYNLVIDRSSNSTNDGTVISGNNFPTGGTQDKIRINNNNTVVTGNNLQSNTSPLGVTNAFIEIGDNSNPARNEIIGTNAYSVNGSTAPLLLLNSVTQGTISWNSTNHALSTITGLTSNWNLIDDVLGFFKPAIAIGSLPATCSVGQMQPVNNWNLTNGVCSSNIGSDTTVATCGASNTWYCP